MHPASGFHLKRGGEEDRPSADSGNLLSPEDTGVKTIQDEQGQVPALSREPKLKSVQPEVSPEPAILPPTPSQG